MIILNSLKDYYLNIDNKEYPIDISLDNVDSAVNYIELNKNIKYAICTDGNDVDGMAGGSIWYLTLQSLNIDCKIFAPKRLDGYGLNIKIVSDLAKEGYQCIITNDNGIRAFEALEYAKKIGIYVILTDHHIPSDILPKADIIINPHINNNHLMTHDICGSYVSFIICKELKIKPSIYNNIMELAALATLSDSMPLIYYNKSIVKKLYNHVESKFLYNYGLDLMFKKYNLYDSFNDDTFSFKVIPLFNSCSRMLNQLDESILILTSNDDLDINNKLDLLFNTNEIRKKETEYYYKKFMSFDKKDDILIFEDNTIKSGICGLIANKISSETNKTCFVISDTHGSGRGSNALSILDQKKELFNTYGGHEEACGFVLKDHSNLSEISQNLIIKEKEEKKLIVIQMHYYETEKLYNEIKFFGPYGHKNEKPLFYDKIDIIDIIYLKNLHTKLLTKNMTFLYFYNLIPKNTKSLIITFHLSKNVWNKQIEFQGIIKLIL